MLTTMEEDVLELWTSTVTSTPMTSPATGLDSTTLSLKMSPAILPVSGQRCAEAVPDRLPAPPPGPRSLTAQQLEGRAEDVQGADEKIKVAQEPTSLEEADDHPEHPSGHAELWEPRTGCPQPAPTQPCPPWHPSQSPSSVSLPPKAGPVPLQNGQTDCPWDLPET